MPTAQPTLPTPLALRSVQERLTEQLSAANAAFSVLTIEHDALRKENEALKVREAALEARIEMLLEPDNRPLVPFADLPQATQDAYWRSQGLNPPPRLIARTPLFEGDTLGLVNSNSQS